MCMKVLVAIPAMNEEITIKQVFSAIPSTIHDIQVEVLLLTMVPLIQQLRRPVKLGLPTETTAESMKTIDFA